MADPSFSCPTCSVSPGSHGHSINAVGVPQLRRQTVLAHLLRGSARLRVAASGASEDAPDKDPQFPHGWAVAGPVEYPLDLGPFQHGPSQSANHMPWATRFVCLPSVRSLPLVMMSPRY